MIGDLLVYLDLPSGDPPLVGKVFFTAKGGQLVSSTFYYDTAYLGWNGAFPIDPELGLHTGAQYVTGLPGAMRDCGPDRWARNLITKARRGAAQGRTLETLTDVDFLVGVFDLTRQGALRFRAREDGPFLRERVRPDHRPGRSDPGRDRGSRVALARCRLGPRNQRQRIGPVRGRILAADVASPGLREKVS